MNMTNVLTIAAFSLGSISVSAKPVTQGTYTAVKGFAETLAITEKDQLGYFRIDLINYQSIIKRRKRPVVLRGVIKGILNDDFTLNHTLVNIDRTGVLYTAGDSITAVYAGDPYCSDTVTPFEIQETLIIVAGTGEYANVLPGSTIVVNGTINNCPSSMDYGRNDFEVTGGTITFQ